MPETETHRIYQLVVDGFKALGAAEPEAIRRAVVFQERTFAGQRFHCDAMQAVWLAGEDLVRFYDSHGKMLKSVKLKQQTVKKAA